MIWVSWRQFRTQAAVALLGLAALAVLVLITGVHLVHLYDTTVRPCAKTLGNCGDVDAQFLRTYQFLQVALPVLVLLIPALIGIFWARRSSPASSRRGRIGSRGRRA